MDFHFPIKPPAFHVMVKPIGSICNLNCTYCYYSEKKNLYPSIQKINENTLEHFIREYINQHDLPLVSFSWQGGEPTILGIDFFKKVIEFQKKHSGEKRIENCLQTNGVLLTDEFCKFFRENQFLIGISIDGPKGLHDTYRTSHERLPSWDSVMRGINLLHYNGVEFNTLTTINDRNSGFSLDIYHFLKQIGSRYMQFLPVVERMATNNSSNKVSLVQPSHKGAAIVTEWSVKPMEFGLFMTQVFDEWVRNDVGECFIQLFDATLATWVNENPGLCIFSEECGKTLVMEHNGDLYTCDHFVYEDHFLGNIHKISLAELVASPKQAIFGQGKKANLTRYCHLCQFKFTCNGDCPKHRFYYTPDGEYGLSYLCKGYKHFFNHVSPFMDFMAGELKAKRPPANVMEWERVKLLS